MKCSVLMALALGMMFTASTAEASGVWSISGASCTVGDPAIQANRYLITGGSVSFQPSATGLITLYCPVPYTVLFNSGASSTTLYVTYADTDGGASASGMGANLVAQLVKLNSSNGALTNIGSAFQSDGDGATFGWRRNIGIVHTFDVNSYYYIRVDLYRTNTMEYSTLYGLSLSR